MKREPRAYRLYGRERIKSFLYPYGRTLPAKERASIEVVRESPCRLVDRGGRA